MTGRRPRKPKKTQPRKPRRPPIPAPKVESGKRPVMTERDEVEFTNEAECGLLDAEFDE